MRKLKLVVQYDGTNYAGFQRQPNVPTVQGTLERAIGECLGHPVTVTAASRTDAGVHAIGQIVCVETCVEIPVTAIPVVFTAALPLDIAVTAAEEVEASFHPRFCARWKRYVYRIVNRAVRSPFLGRFAWCLPQPLAVEMMVAGAQHLKGKHDFRSFCAGGREIRNFVREVSRLDITQEGDVLEIWVESDGFLYKMVRNIVGTLVEVGRDRRAPEQVAQILAARDRKMAGPTAPPQGLCLVKIGY
ncbi:MAG: tRNA pseudouridine(38-40) synthase TruA [Candidatus Zipacnadales bacterium]